jgi:hypothetical protein
MRAKSSASRGSSGRRPASVPFPGRRVVGKSIREAVVQSGGHVGHAPEVLAVVEDHVVHRGEPRASHRARITPLLELRPVEGEAGAVALVFRDFVDPARLLRRVDTRGQHLWVYKEFEAAIDVRGLGLGDLGEEEAP